MFAFCNFILTFKDVYQSKLIVVCRCNSFCQVAHATYAGNSFSNAIFSFVLFLAFFFLFNSQSGFFFLRTPLLLLYLPSVAIDDLRKYIPQWAQTSFYSWRTNIWHHIFLCIHISPSTSLFYFWKRSNVVLIYSKLILRAFAC